MAISNMFNLRAHGEGALAQFPFAQAICYSGYRSGQDPRTQTYPSYDEVLEDLLILTKNWRYIRLYDCSQHALTVLQVIEQHRLPMQVMLGADLAAEASNPDCPWGGFYAEEQLMVNRVANSDEIDNLIALANQYPKIVIALSIGNEASVDWSDHLVPVDTLISYANRVKSKSLQPVSFCENYVPWREKLAPLAAELDFISLHSYPVWEYKTLDEALEYTKQNYYQIKALYPRKPVVITEAGWATQSNGRGIEASNVSQEHQAIYYQQLMNWVQHDNILTFVFEAFDEPWKGSDDPLEPEKHWGLFNEDRTPKLAMLETYSKK